MYVRPDRLPFRRMTFRQAVTAILAAAVAVGYVVVAIVRDVPEDASTGGRSYPGLGFVVIATIGVIGLASLIDAIHDGRARRAALARPEVEQPGEHGEDEQLHQ